MKQEKKGRGRPRVERGTAFIHRHVVNLTDEQQAGLSAFAAQNGIARQTDAIRQLLVKSLRAEGLLA